METNHHDQDKAIATSEDDDRDRGLANNSPPQTRSYECSFCRRGFSNAQALGGHMNIHRKQKAKLKQPPAASAAEIPPPKTEATLNLDNTPTTTLVSSPAPSTRDSWPPQPPWFLRQGHRQTADVVREISDNKFGQNIIQELPLVVEKPDVGSGDGDDGCLNIDLASSSFDQTLDLELRLGRDQPGKGSSSSATRNFF